MTILKSRLGFGTYRILDYFKLKNAIFHVCKLNYDFIDSAKHYQNEDFLGKILLEFKKEYPEHKVPFLQSKVWPSDFQNGIENELKACLKRLNINKIDSFLLHRPHVNMTENVMAWKELIECQKKGLVDIIGVSNFDRDQIQTLYHETNVYPSINQIEASVSYIRYDRILYCKKNKITVQGWRAFGNLQNNFNNLFLKEMANKYNCSIAQVMLAYVLNHQIATICRSEIISEIEDNIEAKNIYLLPKDVALIEKMMNTNIPSTHNGCDSFANLSLDDDWYKKH